MFFVDLPFNSYLIIFFTNRHFFQLPGPPKVTTNNTIIIITNTIITTTSKRTTLSYSTIHATSFVCSPGSSSRATSWANTIESSSSGSARRTSGQRRTTSQPPRWVWPPSDSLSWFRHTSRKSGIGSGRTCRKWSRPTRGSRRVRTDLARLCGALSTTAFKGRLCLSVCPSVCLSFCLSVRLSVCFSVCLLDVMPKK